MPSSQDRYETFAELYTTPETPTFNNVYQSAVGAGFSKHYARRVGNGIMKVKGIAEAVAKRHKELAKLARKKKKIAPPEEVLESYTRDLRFNPKQLVDKEGNFKPLHKLTPTVAASLSKIKVQEFVKSVKEVANDNGDVSVEKIMSRKYEYFFPNKNSVRDSMSKIYGLMNGKNVPIEEFIAALLQSILGAHINIQNNVQVNLTNWPVIDEAIDAM